DVLGASQHVQDGRVRQVLCFGGTTHEVPRQSKRVLAVLRDQKLNFGRFRSSRVSRAIHSPCRLPPGSPRGPSGNVTTCLRNVETSEAQNKRKTRRESGHRRAALVSQAPLHRPFQTGGRFSKNAETPSAASSDAMVRLSIPCRYSKAASALISDAR